MATRKRRGITIDPDRRGGVVIQYDTYYRLMEDAETAVAARKVPVGWTLRRTRDRWEVLDPAGEDHGGGEATLYGALHMAGFVEEV